MIKHILFDLDNTLYPSSYGLEEQVSKRILLYIASYLGVSTGEAAAEREKTIRRYGTTIEWLMAEKNFTAIDDYYLSVHPEDEGSSLNPDPALRDFLMALPCGRAIMTNAPIEHARRMLSALGITDCFSRVFDMRWLGFHGKPERSAFLKVLAALGSSPEETLFVDDAPSYVKGYIALGGRGILIDEQGMHPDYEGEKIKDIKEISIFLG